MRASKHYRYGITLVSCYNEYLVIPQANRVKMLYCTSTSHPSMSISGRWMFSSIRMLLDNISRVNVNTRWMLGFAMSDSSRTDRGHITSTYKNPMSGHNGNIRHAWALQMHTFCNRPCYLLSIPDPKRLIQTHNNLQLNTIRIENADHIYI